MAPIRRVITVICCSAAAAAAADYQQVADRARWGWSDERANPLYCLTQAGDRYDLVLASGPGDRATLTVRVLDRGREAWAWRGHGGSVFRVLGDRLYYADFAPETSGGWVVAVDLAAGRELWRSPLRALGPVEHSKYANRMTLDANADAVSVYGNESLGRYVEFKDARTGRTVGHRVFPVPAAKP